MTELLWSAEAGSLYLDGKIFNPQRLEWLETNETKPDLIAVSPIDALKHIAKTGRLKRVPIGIIGPREASSEQRDVAEALGAEMVDLGLQLICGGKNGVMEAACKGHASRGGLPVGILPDEEWQAANPFVAIPIATGIGPARNAIIARACLVLIAIGGGVGTISEMALGLQFNRLVLSMADAPHVGGVIEVQNVEEALDHTARRLFSIL